jgi:molybdate transport system substrate-binding protein
MTADPAGCGEGSGMSIGRRRLFQLAALLPVAWAGSARADTTDLVVACDTALGPALVAAAAGYASRTGIRVRVFPTSVGLIVPQLEHEVQNDIVVTQVNILDQAAKAGQLAAGKSVGPWRNPLVLGARPDEPAPDDIIAVTDPSPASLLDGHAILARMQRHPGRVMGAVDTAGVSFLLTTGAARSGLLYLTDARANRFDILATVPGDVFPTPMIAAAISRNARRPDPDGFLAFLATPDATDLLHKSGLERAA